MQTSAPSSSLRSDQWGSLTTPSRCVFRSRCLCLTSSVQNTIRRTRTMLKIIPPAFMVAGWNTGGRRPKGVDGCYIYLPIWPKEVNNEAKHRASHCGSCRCGGGPHRTRQCGRLIPGRSPEVKMSVEPSRWVAAGVWWWWWWWWWRGGLLMFAACERLTFSFVNPAAGRRTSATRWLLHQLLPRPTILSAWTRSIRPPSSPTFRAKTRYACSPSACV